MNMQMLLVALSASVALTGCLSSKPSESDAKREVTRIYGQQIGNCKRVTVENFKKINGIQENERSYIVRISYSLKVTPPKENVGIDDLYNKKYEEIYPALKEKNQLLSDISERHSRISQERKEVREQQGRLMGRSDPYMDEGQGELYDKWRALDAESRKMINKSELVQEQIKKLNKSIDELSSEKYDKLMSSFGEGCAAPLRIMSAKYSDYKENGQSVSTMLTTGFVVDFEENIRMIKTDNGWMVKN